jgi:hypothetical protein
MHMNIMLFNIMFRSIIIKQHKFHFSALGTRDRFEKFVEAETQEAILVMDEVAYSTVAPESKKGKK